MSFFKKKKDPLDRKKLKNRLWFYLKKPDYEPITQKQLFKNLKIGKTQKELATSIITELVQEKAIFFQKNKLFPNKQKNDTVEGIFHLHPKGFGFVTPENSSSQDIFIPKTGTSTALNKDKVKVKVFAGHKHKKGPEGTIIEVIQRTKTTLVGIIYDDNPREVIAFCPSLGESKLVGVKKNEKIPVALGDRVLLDIIDFDSYPFSILTTPIQKLGHISEAETDIAAAIHDYNIKENFSKEALDQIKNLPQAPQKNDLKDRQDLTELETITIDPDTAKDFDDALSIIKEKNGYTLIVHIADVSHYVKSDTPLDLEAKERANSLYFPSRCIPMLPEKLSNNLCSLKENVIRLTVSVFMTFNKEGSLNSYDIRRTFIKSNKRFTYKEAKLILDNKSESPHKNSLLMMKELALLLQKKRNQRGSIDFAMEELSLIFDEKENPIGYEIIDYDISHQLVEEFMLKANEVVATHLTDKNIGTLYRTHESPSESDLQDFYDLAKHFGFKLVKKPKKQDLQQLFETAKKTPHLHQLCLAFIKSLKIAIYSENNVGHYGLSLEHYCHFTSPIRRYSDLVIHRLLFEKPFDEEALKRLGQKLSDQERTSFRAESFVLTQKKVRLLNSYYKENPDKVFSCCITKVKPYGLYFDVVPLQFEGFLHISQLGFEYFHYLEKSATLVGEKTNQKFQIGKKIQMQIDQVNIITGEVRFRLF